MNMEDGYHKNFFSSNIILMKVSGVWSFFNKNKSTQPLHVLNTICFVIVLQCCCLDELYLISYVYHRMDLLIGHIGIVLTHVLGNIKVLIVFLNRKKLSKLIEYLEDNRFNYNFPPEINGYEIAKENKILSQRMITFFISLSTFVSMSRAVPSMYMVFTRHEKNQTCMDILPVLLGPFNTDSSFYCFVIINCINIVLIAYAYHIISCDVLYVGSLICLKSHMTVLRKAFETIRLRCMNALNLKYDADDNIQDLNDKRLTDMMDVEMSKCSLHLQTIISNIQIVEEIYNKILLAQVLTVVFMLVSCLYMMSNLSIVSIDFFAQVIYLVALSTQVTFYCWFGNEITLTGSQIPTSIYSGDWYTATIGFKRSMLINMLRLNRDIHLTVGKFSPLTIATLVSIFRGSYSYFAVLKNIEN